MYVNYYDRYERIEGENPTIDISPATNLVFSRVSGDFNNKI